MLCTAVWSPAAHLQPNFETEKGPHAEGDIMPGLSTQEGHVQVLKDYRPLALACHVIKTLERLMLFHLHPLVKP